MDKQILDNAFGHWIAGFTAGEGCFWFAETKERRFQPHFQIHMRDDDASVLFTIARALGCGGVYPARPKRGNPSAAYIVSDIGSLYSIIIPLFKQYPLRGKKAQEFEIWRKAVELMFQIMQTPRVSTRWGWLPRYTKAERAQLGEYAKLLKGLRRYQGKAIQMALPEALKEVQLPMGDGMIREEIYA